MPRLSLLALALLLAACEGETEEAQAPPPPPLSEDVETAAEPVTLPQEPGVVVDIDPAFLIRATLSRDGRQYTAERIEGQWAVDEGAPGADLSDWLARYAPLRADGRASAFVPDSVIFAPDAQVSFFFTDGSGRVVSFKRYGDSLSVVGQPEGPVYRLAPGRLDDLVPPPEAFAP